MDDPPLYSAEQIGLLFLFINVNLSYINTFVKTEVFDGLAEILKEYTKAVIRAQPANIYQFSKELVYTTISLLACTL